MIGASIETNFPKYTLKTKYLHCNAVYSVFIRAKVCKNIVLSIKQKKTPHTIAFSNM